MSAFQYGAFQSSAFEVAEPSTAGSGAFQSGAFQSDAFQTAANDAASTRAGFEMVGRRVVSRKPILRRILEERAERLKRPPTQTLRKKAKAIEVEAARLALDGGGESSLTTLMRQWRMVRSDVPAEKLDTHSQLEAAFFAQVAMRIRQLQDEQDEEEAILALFG